MHSIAALPVIKERSWDRNGNPFHATSQFAVPDSVEVYAFRARAYNQLHDCAWFNSPLFEVLSISSRLEVVAGEPPPVLNVVTAIDAPDGKEYYILGSPNIAESTRKLTLEVWGAMDRLEYLSMTGQQLSTLDFSPDPYSENSLKRVRVIELQLEEDEQGKTLATVSCLHPAFKEYCSDLVRDIFGPKVQQAPGFEDPTQPSQVYGDHAQAQYHQMFQSEDAESSKGLQAIARNNSAQSESAHTNPCQKVAEHTGLNGQEPHCEDIKTIKLQLSKANGSSRRRRPDQRIRARLIHWRWEEIGDMTQRKACDAVWMSERTYRNYSRDGLFFSDEEIRQRGTSLKELWQLAKENRLSDI